MRGKNALALRKFHSLGELFFGTRAVPVPLYRIARATGRGVRFLSARFHEFIVLSVRSFIYLRIVVLSLFYIIYARRSRFSRERLGQRKWRFIGDEGYSACRLYVALLHDSPPRGRDKGDGLFRRRNGA